MFGKRLTQIRERLGYKSARQFYLWLEQSARLDFNYSYYVKIESGKVLPSEKVVQTLAALLSEEDAKGLVIDFCKNLFPDYGHFFPSSMPEPELKDIKISSETGTLLRKQKYLNLKQVSVISSSKHHYFIFLLITLSRRPVTFPELKKHFAEGVLTKVVDDLSVVKILKRGEDSILSISKELRFPLASDDADLKKKYQQLDHWDREFSAHFQLSPVVQSFLIRRISPRFLPLVEKQAQTLIEIIQMSEEIDSDYNSEVLQFNLSLTRGFVPG